SNQELISTLEGRLVELELEEKQLLAKYTDQSRRVKNVREEIAIVKRRLAAQEKKSYGRKRSGVNPTYQSLQQELYRNEAELNALKAKGQTQKSQLADYQAKLEELNQIEVKINQLQEQVDVDRQNYRLYLAKFEESRISDAMDAERISSVSLLEPARQPMKPVSPKVLLNLLIALVVGAFGGLGLAFFVDYLDDSLETVEAVEEHLQMPVLLSVGEEKT
ncbi:MAG: GNVR domain-containing protein, partial [Desulfobacteraceae bacterium]